MVLPPPDHPAKFTIAAGQGCADAMAVMAAAVVAILTRPARSWTGGTACQMLPLRPKNWLEAVAVI